MAPGEIRVVGDDIGWSLPLDVSEILPSKAVSPPIELPLLGMQGPRRKFTSEAIDRLLKIFPGKFVKTADGNTMFSESSSKAMFYDLIDVNGETWMIFRPTWQSKFGNRRLNVPTFEDYVDGIVKAILADRKEQRTVEKDLAARIAVVKEMPLGPSIVPYLGGRKRKPTRRQKKRRTTRRR